MDIVFEDNHILIINKKAGQLSQSDKTGDISVLDLCKSYIKKKYNKTGEISLLNSLLVIFKNNHLGFLHILSC